MCVLGFYGPQYRQWSQVLAHCCVCRLSGDSTVETVLVPPRLRRRVRLMMAPVPLPLPLPVAVHPLAALLVFDRELLHPPFQAFLG
jgi:hypothetical protein